MNKIQKRNPIIEKRKYQIQKAIATLNPFSTISGRAFRITLNREIVLAIEKLLKQKRKQQEISRKNLKQIYFLLNKHDNRDFGTVFVQELLAKTKNIQQKNKLNFLCAIKMSALAVIYPTSSVKAQKILGIVKPFLQEIALNFANNYDPKFAIKLENIFAQPEKYQEQQKLLPIKIRLAKNLLWNQAIAYSEVVAKELREWNCNFELAQTFSTLIKYQLLFNETTTSLNQPKMLTIVKQIDYAFVSQKQFEYLQTLQKIWTSNNLKFTTALITHLTETTEKVYLSDLPKLSPYQFASLLVSYLLLLLWSLVIIFPLVQMIVFSFDGSRINKISETPSANRGPFIHYQNLWTNTDFKYWLTNSLIVAFATMALTVIITVLLAYAFSRFKFKGKKSSMMGIMLLQMVPSIAALTAFLVLFQMVQEGFKIGVLPFLIIIYTGGAITGNTFILKGYFDSIPRDLDQAASIDGASKIRTFWTILIPLVKPMIAIVALWSFIGPFGDVILPNLLNDGTKEASKNLTMAAGLKTLITVATGQSVFELEYLAGAIITSLPIALMFIGAQKFIVSGLTAGAVK